MVTYLVIDIEGKQHYVGSTEDINTGRPWSHLNGGSSNKHLARITKKRNCFVFVSEDDGLSTREEEQFYLDFYYGTKWCVNNSPTATGNPQAIKGYNEKVKNGELPQSVITPEGKTVIIEATRKSNKKRIEEGTHNFLKEKRDEEQERRRIEAVSKAVKERNSKELEEGTHPFLNPLVRENNKKAQKNQSKRFRKFGLKSKTPELTSEKMSQAHKRNRGAKQSADRARAARVASLSRYGGFLGLFPETCEFRTSLSSDFINYFSHYGKWD